MKIVVLGYIVRGPLGGLVWHHFQYVLALLKLGHDVLFLEDSEEYATCYNPETFVLSTNPSYGLNFIKTIFSRYNIDDRWAYFDFHTNRWFGKSKSDVFSFLKNADVIINISGVNPLREWAMKIPVRIFIDTDPVFTQVKHLTDPDTLYLARQHNNFFTFGENFGKSNCTIPDDGIAWKATRQPVVIDLWKNDNIKNNGTWTTVMQWDSYKSREWNDVSYGMKSKSFEEYISLPEIINEKFELALGSESAPIVELMKLGWKIENPLKVTKTPESYQNYIWDSKGEWSVAKHGYVVTTSGWFSERSAVYLACGKPVVVQDTGLIGNLPLGKGLFVFRSLHEATLAIDEINGNYRKHSDWAKEVAFEYFDARSIMKKLLVESGMT